MSKRYFKIYISCMYVCVFVSCLWGSASWALEISDCMGCHGTPSERGDATGGIKGMGFDLERFRASVHGENEVTCTECHSDIEELNMDEKIPHGVDLAPIDCGACHDEVAEIYGRSIHGTDGKEGKPVPCYGCHEYHYVTRLELQTIDQRVANSCKKCHDAMKFHQWLPQRGLHFSVVQCPVCHAPEASNYVGIRPLDRETGNPLSGPAIVKEFGADYNQLGSVLDTDGSGQISVVEYVDLFFKFYNSKLNALPTPELVVNLDHRVHNILKKTEATRQCETCHNAKSQMFDNVYLVLNGEGGQVHKYPIEKRVLRSLFAVHDLYVVGGTRVTLIDYAGLVLIFGGLFVVSIHTIARILTIPVRKKAKAGH